MKHPNLVCRLAAALSPVLLLVIPGVGSVLPEQDERARGAADLNTPRSFPEIRSKNEWERWSRQLRQQVLVSNGLWPMPERPPVRAHRSGRIDRDDYSVENVYFETGPGFYLAGNLYLPRGQGPGPFPAILNPHGHWREGRLVDSEDGSVAARCIHFARHGMIAFAYDMVGYNDTIQVNHKFASHPENQLWNISLMGLQTWNSIRALDFLEALPETDRRRLACTGASGGGTQTFILGAIEDRLAAVAPAVMVSHSMQGGCLCENAPGLRVRHSNMEIAAAFAPRPQVLISATGDWTRATMTVEGPAIAQVYRLLSAPDRFHYAVYDFRHNYNQTSREAVYAWFAEWLLDEPSPAVLKEAPYTKEPDADLRLWPDGEFPPGALSEEQLIESLKAQARRQLEQLTPRDPASLRQFKETMLPAWQRTLQVDHPEGEVTIRPRATSSHQSYSVTSLALGRAGRGDRIPALLFTPAKGPERLRVVLAHPEGKRAWSEGEVPTGLARQLLEAGHSVLLADLFLTGELADPEAEKRRDYFANYFTTYNRTDLQERVHDLTSLCTFARGYSSRNDGPGTDPKVVLWGTGRAGLWSMLAAPAADVILADAQQLDPEDESAHLARDLFAPGLLKMGGLRSALALAAPNPLFLHNAGEQFDTGWIKGVYAAVNAGQSFEAHPNPVKEADALRWLSSLK